MESHQGTYAWVYMDAHQGTYRVFVLRDVAARIHMDAQSGTYIFNDLRDYHSVSRKLVSTIQCPQHQVSSIHASKYTFTFCVHVLLSSGAACALCQARADVGVRKICYTDWKIFYPGLSYSITYTPPCVCQWFYHPDKSFFHLRPKNHRYPTQRIGNFLNTPVPGALKQLISPVNLIDSQNFAVPIVHPVVKNFPPGLCRSSAFLHEQAFITPSSCGWMDRCLPFFV